MAARYVPDHKSFGEFMMSAQIAYPIIQITAKVAKAARANTPLGPGPRHMRDQYRESTKIIPIGRRRARRVAGVVSNNSPHAASVEFGTSKMKARRPLGRAAAMYGEFKGSLE